MKRLTSPRAAAFALNALCCGLVLSVLPASVFADVRLPAVFSSHMVLQRDMEIPVWGWADPGEKVVVALGKQSSVTTASAEGRWSLRLGKLPAGGPYELTVVAGNTVTIPDVLIGEVWLASGQSNMAMTVNRANNPDQEAAAAKFPQIRMFTVSRVPASEPQSDCQGSWTVCSPETVSGFSATAYFFARELHRELKVPIGILNSSVGGTAIEAWTSWDAQKDRGELKQHIFAPWEQAAATFNADQAEKAYLEAMRIWRERAATARNAGEQPPRAPRKPVHPSVDANHPATLFNGMIAPLIPYGIRGAIWYQGERNSRTPEVAHLYRLQLPLLISDWRGRWGQGDFPFAWVQLPNFDRTGDGWSIVRESMLVSLQTPHTGMAITIDIGDPGDIHPKNKQDVGKRLALWALGDVYGKQVSATSGPIYESHKVQGDKVVLSFKHAAGLKFEDDHPSGFLIAGADGRFVPAKAAIEGDEVVVFSPEVKSPRTVRYHWTSNPSGHLRNAAGLPASPFRTDVPR